MRIRIQIQVISLRFTEFNKQKIILSYFFAYFILDEPLRNVEIYIITLFSKVQIWVLGVIKFFFEDFGWYFTPYIRIQEA